MRRFHTFSTHCATVKRSLHATKKFSACVGYGIIRCLPLLNPCNPFPSHSLTSLETIARWFRTAKNRDVGNGPLAPELARSLAPLTHLVAPHFSLRSRAPLRSFVYSLAHLLPSSWEIDLCLLNERVDFMQLKPTVLWHPQSPYWSVITIPMPVICRAQWVETVWNWHIQCLDIIFFPLSFGVSGWASQQISAAERSNEANSAEQANEWAVRVTDCAHFWLLIPYVVLRIP